MGRKKKKSLVGWTYKNWDCRLYYFDDGTLRVDDIFRYRQRAIAYALFHVKKEDMPIIKKVRITIEEL